MFKNWKHVLAVAIGLLMILSIAKADTAQDAAGKKLFLDNKCNTCHQIESQAILKKGATKLTPPAEIKGPKDLSNVGMDRTPEWFAKFLKKEVELDGKKHGKLWEGKDEDLKTLTTWLASLKTKKT